MYRDEDYFMQLALYEAGTAQRKGEVPVGALVVCEGEVLSSGFNQSLTCHDPTAHAEIVALRRAADLRKNHRLPVIVHVRKAMDQVISLLRKNKPEAGVIHSFAGSQQQAEQLMELGFKLGIAATVDFERAKKLRSVVATIDEQGLLLESDAPDQPGVNHRGERNEPAFIVEHFETIARLRNTSADHLSKVLHSNTCLAFKAVLFVTASSALTAVYFIIPS